MSSHAEMAVALTTDRNVTEHRTVWTGRTSSTAVYIICQHCAWWLITLWTWTQRIQNPFIHTSFPVASPQDRTSPLTILVSTLISGRHRLTVFQKTVHPFCFHYNQVRFW